MNPESPPKPNSGDDNTVDEQIRGLFAKSIVPGTPTDINTRVFAKIQQRRWLTRVTCAALVLLLASVVTTISSKLKQQNRSQSSLTQFNQASGLEGLATDFLAAPPPVVLLEHLAQDQSVLLHHLKTLEGDLP